MSDSAASPSLVSPKVALPAPTVGMSRFVTRNLARSSRSHADVSALVRASLEDLRRSELALELQLGDLRRYIGGAGIVETRQAF